MKEEDMRMDAYYYGFEETGVIEIDRILSAVATAGKAYHNTADWTDIIDYGDLKGMSVVDNIQKIAKKSANAWEQKQAEIDEWIKDRNRWISRYTKVRDEQTEIIKKLVEVLKSIHSFSKNPKGETDHFCNWEIETQSEEALSEGGIPEMKDICKCGQSLVLNHMFKRVCAGCFMLPKDCQCSLDE